MSEGRSPGREVLDGVLVLIGGFLLIVPGFLSDVVGLLALLPPTRSLLRGRLARHLQSRFVVGATRFGRPHATVRRRFDRDRRRPVPAAGMTALRTLAFGDGSVWGASWSSDPAGASLTAVGAGPEVMVLPGVRLPASDSHGSAGEEWRLESDGVALVATPVGELVDVEAGQDGIEGWDQLCRVSGRFGEHEVDCLGLRSAWSDAIDLGALSSRSVPSRSGSTPTRGSR